MLLFTFFPIFMCKCNKILPNKLKKKSKNRQNRTKQMKEENNNDESHMVSSQSIPIVDSIELND